MLLLPSRKVISVVLFSLIVLLAICTRITSSQGKTEVFAAARSRLSGILFYLVTILSSSSVTEESKYSFEYIDNAYSHTWPDLKFNWRVGLGSLISFLGAALGSAGGVGGGSIFVPMLRLVLGFDPKTSTAMSKCMIMGTAAATVLLNLRLKHPAQNLSLIDYDVALLLQPMLLLGISIGVTFNIVFPNWTVTLLLVIIFIAACIRTSAKGITSWMQESQKKLLEKGNAPTICQDGEEERGVYKVLPGENKESTLDPLSQHRHWKRVVTLLFVWVSFLVLQILKNYVDACSGRYWFLNILQIPVAVPIFSIEAMSLYKQSKGNNELSKSQHVCSATIQWRIPQLLLSAASGLLAGVVGGLLGLGGGFVLGPLLLEFGLHPQSYTATSTFIMLFSSSMSVVEYHLLHRFPVPFAIYLILVSMLGGFFGQYVIRKVVNLFGRASIIIFLLAVLNFASAWTLGTIGVVDAIAKLKRGEYMGFLNLCH
eukprot:c22811_g1_i1 orf=701-2152(-)